MNIIWNMIYINIDYSVIVIIFHMHAIKVSFIAWYYKWKIFIVCSIKERSIKRSI